MRNAREANLERKATIAARVPLEIKEAMVALADAGNRSTSTQGDYLVQQDQAQERE